jgi:hypothetical protein
LVKLERGLQQKVLVSIRHVQEPEHEDIPFHVTIVTRRSQNERVTNFNNNNNLHLLVLARLQHTSQKGRFDFASNIDEIEKYRGIADQIESAGTNMMFGVKFKGVN